MLDKIDIRKIIFAHYKSLANLNSKGIRYSDVFLFIIVPILISFLLTNYNISIKKQVENLITAMSILAGFLFNLLAIIHTSLGKIKLRIKEKSEDGDNIKFRFANEIHSNISYNILVALLLIISLVIYAFDINFANNCYNFIFSKFFNFLCLFFFIHFILTMFMILNRIYILLDKEDL